jgi:putative zinc finger protein
MNDRPMMTCAEVDEVLLAYLEETLDRASRSNVDQHVASCVRCSAIMRDLAAIRSEAERLPELAPSRDLWKGISERIEPAVLPLSVPSRTAIPSRWIPFAAAAAATLVIGTAGITYLATSRSLGPSSSRVAVATQPAAVATQPAGVVPESVATNGTPEETQSGPEASAGSAEAQAAASRSGAATRTGQPAAALASRRSGATASSSDIAYGDEIKQLQNIITDRRRELDPATISVIEESLKIIDAAVKQSRAALARDPRSGFLVDQLNSALDKKVELLRTVALLPSRT